MEKDHVHVLDADHMDQLFAATICIYADTVSEKQRLNLDLKSMSK